MQWQTVLKRLVLVLVLVIVTLAVSACYKDAGDDLQPTSRQVDLTDIAPTATSAPPTVTSTTPPLPTSEPVATATRTLVPTTTPAGFVAESATEEPSPSATADVTDVEAEGESDGSDATPTQFLPNGDTAAGTPTPTEILITTPGMSDIMPTVTPRPTVDPAFQPTPTAIPVEENPCIHVVSPNDTLYSIAQDNDVRLADLVAANAQYLGGSAATPLQIGWELNIPGCVSPEDATATAAATAAPAAEAATPSDDADVAVTAQPGAAAGEDTGSEGPNIHTVQVGEGIYSIARQYGVDPQAIIDANNLVNPALIYPGDELVIPQGQ